MLGWNASQEIGARSFFADIPKEKSAAENWQRSNTVTRYTHLTRAIQIPERNKTALYFVAFIATNKARAPQQNIRFVGVRGTTGCGAGLPKPGATPSLWEHCIAEGKICQAPRRGFLYLCSKSTSAIA